MTAVSSLFWNLARAHLAEHEAQLGAVHEDGDVAQSEGRRLPARRARRLAPIGGRAPIGERVLEGDHHALIVCEWA